nr:hypothetical protein [Tanacetum cinerariifolium]GEW95774.1 hypothetical protein [Tanacetum cinerariifolium]
MYAAKLPILNHNEFDLWKMRIEQYFLMTDYSLWEVILNGDSSIPTRVIDGVVQPVAPTTVEQRLARKNELKARGAHCAKTFMEAIEKWFGGNKETKKVQNTLLKQQYEKLTGSSSESLDQIHDGLQKLISQLKILVSAVTSVSAASSKVLVSALPNVDTLSDAVIYSFFASQSNNPQLDNDDLKKIDADDLEEMDLKWQMAMVTMRARSYNWSFQAEEEPTNYALMAFTSSTSSSSDNEVASYSKACTKAYATLQSHYDKLTNDLRKSQFDVLSYKTGLESVEARLVIYQQNETVFEEDIKWLKLDLMLRDNALVDLRKKFKKAEQERDELKLKLGKFQTSSRNLSHLLASQTSDKTRLGYDNQVFNSTVLIVMRCLVLRTFMPLKTDLVFYDALTVNETVPTAFDVEPSPIKPDMDLSQSNRPFAPIIEDWVSDSEVESEGGPMPTHKAPSFVQTSEHIKTPRPFVKPVEHPIPAENLRKDILKSRGHRHSRNKKACFVCKSLTHLIQGLHVVPTIVLTRSRLVPLNAARPVNTAVPQTKVQHQRPTTHGVNKAHSPLRRPINLIPSPQASNFPQKVTTAKAPQANAVKGVKGNWGNSQHALKDKGVIDSGCSRHMTENISYLFDFEEINRGYVSLGGNPKGGKIACKGKTRTEVRQKVKHEASKDNAVDN